VPRAALGVDTWLGLRWGRTRAQGSARGGTWLGQRWGRTRVVIAKPAFSPGSCYQPGLKKHTDRVFLSSACETLDQGCVSFEGL
jgi:hypothetical protein